MALQKKFCKTADKSDAKPSLKGLLPCVLFVAQWLIWSVWQIFAVPELPAGTGWLLLESVVAKGLVWAAPVILILCLTREKQNKLFKEPFPWLACVVLLCLTTAFLYTVRLASGLANTHAIFDPMFLVFSLSAGVFEEISFRGGLFNFQESKLGFWPAALLNGAMFTLYHYPELLFGGSWAMLLSWRSLLIFTMGIVFCWMFRKWRNLALNMTVHTVWDVLSFLFCIAG